MNKVLFLLTNFFPYGKGETFLESEIKFLEDFFDEIHIISTDNINPKTRTINKSTTVNRINLNLSKIDKLTSFLLIFNPIFKNEKNIIKNTYKLKWNRLIRNTTLVSLKRSLLINNYISRYIKSNNLNKNNIYAYSYWSNDTAIGLANLKKNNPYIKTFCRMHGWDLYFDRSESKYLPFRSFLFENTDKVFFISEHGYNYINNIHSGFFSKYSNKFSISKIGTKELDSRSPHTEKKYLNLISCSLIYPNKRIDLIINALSKIDDINIKWTHFGEGFKPHFEIECKQLAKELLSKKDNVEYCFKGNIPNESLLKYYSNNSIDLLINVSESEGIPVSIMEAFSAGISVIATKVGGTPEIVNKKNGYLINSNPTINEICDSIRSFYNLNNNERIALKEEAYNTWKKNYQSELNYINFIKNIESI